MDIAEANEVLAATRERLNGLVDPLNEELGFVVGFQVIADDLGNPVVQIALEYGKQKNDLPQAFHVSEIEIPGRDISVPVTYINQSRAYALGNVERVSAIGPSDYELRSGMRARAQGGSLSGTVGWGFMIEADAYVLGNWHIFCPDGNASEKGARISISGFDVAELSFFEPMRTSGNIWDFAIAKIDDPRMLLGEFVRCAAHRGSHNYPLNVEHHESPRGDPHYIVKSTRPYCAIGFFKGTCDWPVTYPDGTVRVFKDQLMSSATLGPGDSGCVAVSYNTKKVNGLLFAKNNKYAIANPLYRRNWIKERDVDRPNGTAIPAFQSIDNYP